MLIIDVKGDLNLFLNNYLTYSDLDFFYCFMTTLEGGGTLFTSL